MSNSIDLAGTIDSSVLRESHYSIPPALGKANSQVSFDSESNYKTSPSSRRQASSGRVPAGSSLMAQASNGRLKAARGEGGQALVEFALVCPMFLFLVFATLDFARLFFVQMEVQEAVQEAGRFASTGNVLPNPNNAGQSLSRLNSIIQTAEQAAPGIDFSGLQISSVGGGVGSLGGPGSIVTISLTTNLKLMTPFVARLFKNGQYTFTASTTFKNEPFPASVGN